MPWQTAGWWPGCWLPWLCPGKHDLHYTLRGSLAIRSKRTWNRLREKAPGSSNGETLAQRAKRPGDRTDWRETSRARLCPAYAMANGGMSARRCRKPQSDSARVSSPAQDGWTVLARCGIRQPEDSIPCNLEGQGQGNRIWTNRTRHSRWIRHSRESGNPKCPSGMWAHSGNPGFPRTRLTVPL